ncbi:hypothetical protein [Magnetospirillum molischianum]|uniref:Uncharacterized protein n=1 Tax=Magnetospirillum molischianum DSM 120 TaxID=1150626 RepID=H8FR90_MAGML|nr:hypothetical protein [Magnetospirillum molischianum]CCG40878.1 hypothetical protein PHAMO_210389 [Magnetospirillum molischianum DSM 120]
MSARILTLPRTPAGRALLRDCIPYTSDWRWPNGDPIEIEDFDEQAVLMNYQPTQKHPEAM